MSKKQVKKHRYKVIDPTTGRVLTGVLAPNGTGGYFDVSRYINEQVDDWVNSDEFEREFGRD